MNEDFDEFIDASTIVRRGVLAVAAAIFIPFCLLGAASVLEMKLGPLPRFGFPYDNYIGLSLLVIYPLFGFVFIWRQFREFALWIAAVYFPIMFILMMYLTLEFGHYLGGDLP